MRKVDETPGFLYLGHSNLTIWPSWYCPKNFPPSPFILGAPFYFRAKLWKSKARPDKVWGTEEEDGKMRSWETSLNGQCVDVGDTLKTLNHRYSRSSSSILRSNVSSEVIQWPRRPDHWIAVDADAIVSFFRFWRLRDDKFIVPKVSINIIPRLRDHVWCLPQFE